MMAQAVSPAETRFTISPATRMGHVALTVADLERQIGFYQKYLGFQLHWRQGGTAGLGAGGADLLRLTEMREARRVPRTTGLYHFAVLLPSRRELARALARLFSLRYINYPTDHVMTQTTYLDDPEGNGIELYADTPEEGFFGFANGEFVARDAQGRARSGRDPLDVEALLRLLRPEDRLEAPAPPATTMGHVHLHVADVEQAVDFYAGLLGFEVQGVSARMGAAFVSAGGYHHHLGLNTWVGRGAPPPPPGSLGLRYFTVVLPDNAELERVAARVQAAGLPVEQTEADWLVRDPSQNALVLASHAEKQESFAQKEVE
jgi:catechol 2,3-dioxygenase